MVEFPDEHAGYGLLVILNAVKNPGVVGIYPPLPEILRRYDPPE
jgi:hypothetical protein